MSDSYISLESIIPDDRMITLYPAFIDAKEIYIHVCRNQTIFEKRPVQFFPVTKLPDWVDDKFRSEPCVFLGEKSGETDICLIVVSPCMLETVDKIIRQEIECVRYYSMSLSDLNCFPFYTHIPGKQLIKIYKHALAIAEEMQIAIPTIMISEQINQNERANRLTKFKDDEEDNIPDGDIITIYKAGMIYMIHSLAHELRHHWQEYHAKGYFKNFITLRDAVSELQYNYQIEEIDAEAYACIYLNTLGYDGMKYTCDQTIDPVMYRVLNKRINEIMKETPTHN